MCVTILEKPFFMQDGKLSPTFGRQLRLAFLSNGADKTTSLPKARTEEKHVYDGNDDNDDDDDDDDDENLDEVGDESKVFTDGLVLGLQTH